MKRFNSRIVWGGLLILVGLLLLLENLNVIAIGSLWALLFAVPGALFVITFFTQREHWWAIIPGLSLLGLAALIFIESAFPEANDPWGAGIFLGSIGLSFVGVYLRTGQWWAIIPAGALLSLGVNLFLEPFLPEDVFAGFFMLGLAATFGMVYLLTQGSEDTQWALYPAGILALISMLILVAMTSVIRYIWPIALILGGGYLILRTLRRGEE
jgi:hypothetical protein